MLWEHEPRASVSTAFLCETTTEPQNIFLHLRKERNKCSVELGSRDTLILRSFQLE